MMAQRLARRDWRSGGPRFKSHPRLIFQSWSSYQLNQLDSKAASDSTLKQLTTCEVSNTGTLLFINQSYTYTQFLRLCYRRQLFEPGRYLRDRRPTNWDPCRDRRWWPRRQIRWPGEIGTWGHRWPPGRSRNTSWLNSWMSADLTLRSSSWLHEGNQKFWIKILLKITW